MAEETRNNDAGVNLVELRQTLATRFSESDLRDLAFDLDIEYESLPGTGKSDKAREIIAYCRHHSRVPELLTVCHRLRSDVGLTASPPTPSALSKPIHQLRNPVADFVGRAAEIEELVQVLRSAASGTTGATAIIRGLGGLGKTQLANMVAQRLRDKFPDGQLFLELQGVNDNAIPPERVVQRVIQTFEPQAQVPEALGELQAFYRSILDGKRVLIVADNAKDEAQVRSLEPPPGCALLVTSRQHFSLPGAVVLNLAALPQAEAEGLLLKLCPRIKSSASRLAELCGRLPLALRVSASLLENDVTQNVAHYLQALEKERLHYLSDPESPNDPNVSVSASLNLSYKALNDARQRILRQISVFPASFDLKAAKAVISLQGIKAGAGDERELQAAHEAAGQIEPHPPTAPIKLRGRAVVPREEDSLGILYLRSLVEYDIATERYNLHDLVRAFASERLKTTDEQMRYVRHYLKVAQEANHLYSQGHEYILQGLGLFDHERIHIDAAWEWLLQQTENQSTDDLLIAFTTAMGTIGYLRHDRQRERIPRFEASLAAARRLRRKNTQANFLDSLGSDYRELGETRRAMELHEQALHIYREIGDHSGEGGVLGNLGQDYASLGDLRQAIDYYEQHLTIARKSRNKSSEALNNLGLAYIDLGDAQQAITFFERALRSAQETGERDAESSVLGNLGRAYVDLGDAAQAIVLCEQSLAIKRQIGNRWHEGYALNFLGLAYAAAGELQRAHELQEEARVIAREVGDRRIEGVILNALGKIDLRQDNLEAATDHLNQSLAIARHIEDRQGEALASWNLGLTYERQGELARAAELMRVRVDYEREIGHLKAEERAARLAQVRAQLEAGGEEAGAG